MVGFCHGGNLPASHDDDDDDDDDDDGDVNLRRVRCTLFRSGRLKSIWLKIFGKHLFVGSKMLIFVIH